MERKRERLHCIIVGGGIAGLDLAKEFEKTEEFNVTLISNKDFVEFTPLTARALVDTSLVRPLRTPLRSHLKRTEVIIGVAKDITPQQLNIMLCKDTDGETIVRNFDILVLAMGARQNNIMSVSPGAVISDTERDAQFSKANAQLKAAKKVLIVGGGAVGVEVAGEILCAPGLLNVKEVCIVHSRRALFERIPEAIGNRAMDALTRHGDRLNIYLGEYAEEANAPQFPFKKIWVTSKTKTEIKDVDMCINCVGTKPNSEPMEKYMSECLDAKGFVKVDESLRVLRPPPMDGSKENRSYHHIFCLGDLNDLPVEKMLKNAKAQAEFAADAIERAAQVLQAYRDKGIKSFVSLEDAPPKIGAVPKEKPGMVITLGPHRAMLHLNTHINVVGWRHDGSKIASVIKHIVEKNILSQWRSCDKGTHLQGPSIV